jgi:PPM family protein phosphatase
MEQNFDDARRRELFSSVLSADDFRPPSEVVRAEFAARSHRGRVPAEHDDHYLVVRLGRHMETLFTSLVDREVPYRFDEYGYGAVVADGIGRDGAGSVAARLAITTLAHLELRFGQWSMRIDPETAAELMERSEWFYRRTHEAVLRWNNAHVEAGRIAAALTGVYSAGRDLFVAHVGHSRCYLFRKGVLTQLTRDQTLRERLATTPQPTPVGRAIEDLRHLLTNAIGGDSNSPGVRVEQFRLFDDDSILLCTNGLTDMVSDDEIADVLSARRTPAEQCDFLIDLALANGGTDNVTVVLGNYEIPDLQEEQAEQNA